MKLKLRRHALAHVRIIYTFVFLDLPQDRQTQALRSLTKSKMINKYAFDSTYNHFVSEAERYRNTDTCN